LSALEESADALFLDPFLKNHSFAARGASALPNELPWTGKPFGRSREPISWIIVLANPVFQVAGVAAVEAAGGLTLQNVDPVHDKKAGENLPRLKNGS